MNNGDAIQRQFFGGGGVTIIIFIFLIFLLSEIFLNSGSGEERKITHGLGLIPEIPEKARVVKKVLPLRNTPDVRTMRGSVDNSNYLPPVGDQKFENSCVAWALGYYVKGYLENREHGWNKNIPSHMMSPSFVYNHINGGEDDGAYFSDAAKLICNMGICPLSDFPYNPNDYVSWPDARAYFDAIKYRADGYHWLNLVTMGGVDNLKQLLMNGNIAVLEIYVWDNFFNINYYNNTYCIADKIGEMHGMHAVTVVGFDDNMSTRDGTGAFKLVNSWGSQWGDGGFFWMSYKAVIDPNLSYRWALYLDDKIDYHPKTLALLNIEHPRRGDLMRYGIRVGNDMAYKTFLNFSIWNLYMSEGKESDYQDHPFPKNMIFDITDIVGTIYSGEEFHVLVNDTRIGYSGKIKSFEIFYLPEKSSAMSMEIPRNIPSYSTAKTEVSLRFEFGFHTPIKINSNKDFYELNGIFSGSGSSGNPYIIEKCDIDAHGKNYGVKIENTTAHFILRNCKIYNTSANNFETDCGIYLNNIQHGTFKNNTVWNVGVGFYLLNSRGNAFFNNSISDYRIIGFYVNSNTIYDFDNNIDKSNMVNGNAVYYYFGKGNFTLNNISSGHITIAKCSYFRLSNISIENGDGLRIFASSSGKIDNFTLKNDKWGMKIIYSSYINLKNGSVNNSAMGAGININSSYCIFISNISESSSYNGFFIKNSEDISMEKCNGLENEYHGVSIYRTEYLKIEKCRLGNNAIDGIHLEYSENDIIEKSEIFSNTRYGIYLYNTKNTTIKGNSIKGNTEYGVYISSASSNNTIYLNTFSYNRYSTDNFNRSSIQAYDDGTYNHWNSSQYGNCWMDWQMPDKNHDGFVDNPYPIDGGAGAMDYFPMKRYSYLSPARKYCFIYYLLTFLLITVSVIASLIYRRKKLIQGGDRGAVNRMYAVFKFRNGEKRVNDIYQDELLSRQSIAKRDGKSLGLNDDSVYLIIEGSEEAIRKAREIAGENEIREGEEIYRKVKESEEEASLGMGAIFG